MTDADHAAEQCIVDYIRAHFPTHSTLAEERGHDAPPASRYQWIIDPLDGTTNYSHGLPPFAVSVAYERDGQVQVGVIYDPTQDELFVASRGGGATLNGQPMHVSNVSILRRALVASVETQSDRIVADFHAVLRDTPLFATTSDKPPREAQPWAWIIAGIALIVALASAALWRQEAQFHRTLMS